ncbi:MAG TPA: hypothetical protein PK620_07770 [Denitromonas sp.]|uniref:hypothetical protein n=1 Tax=Denitromonas sp. TaxID=2734609 RepID=UPI001D557C5E|nr:hypothetical protein [Rhodocyclaceae bacterium]MCP5223031.1 hypothetical protein [Zoogloeaceae bacterium]HPR06056.1 hypothetical protein [Denitromonas sp.]HQU88101.1 hypothetical protein [Denitromonas sp.]HQV14800.1 hypothetical protein [Denitromonas sp.]
MPIPWLAAAKIIPWTEVIAAAPGIARGARDLWKRTKTREEAQSAPDTVIDDPVARLTALERSVAELTQEAEQGSELIAQLAEQNQRLVATLDRQKRNTQWALILAIAALLGLAVVLMTA